MAAPNPSDPTPHRQPRSHVFIIDGTLSRFEEGRETNAGLLYRLLREQGPVKGQTFGYDPGVQGRGFWKWLDVMMGQGINESILNGYATLASRYRPGDRIMLFGYSRGAYAVRSLAGMIGRVGLIRADQLSGFTLSQAFRHYAAEEMSAAARRFAGDRCHGDVPVEMIGIWDTVRALGLPWPLLARLAPMATGFHDHTLGPNIRNGFHALALDEDRLAYEPVVWTRAPGWQGRMEQAWFAGAHADVGGNVWRNPAARALSNIPFLWIAGMAADCGLILPEGWRAGFVTDPAAPAIGNQSGRQRLFRARAPRRIGEGSGEFLHDSVAARIEALPGYAPKARLKT